MRTEILRPDIAPLEFLQLAGHPLRWRLLEALARGDLMVHELTGLIGEPQNLVSYHLGKLRDGRLVRARRSSADGRDTYYTADLARIGGRLSAAGGALHPALRLAALSLAAPKKSASKKAGAKKAGATKVLFLCTGNSARSQMAEALARARSGGAVEAFSAGSDPKPLHANAVRAMRAVHGIDIAGQAAKHLSVFAGRRFDVVISLCDRVREVCPPFPGAPETIHWSIANPASGDADDATYPLFLETAEEIGSRVAFLLAALDDRAGAARAAKTKPKTGRKP